MAISRFFRSDAATDSIPAREFVRDDSDERSEREPNQVGFVHDARGKRDAHVVVEEREDNWFVVQAALCQAVIDRSEKALAPDQSEGGEGSALGEPSDTAGRAGTRTSM
jgi:hypothetical protein